MSICLPKCDCTELSAAVHDVILSPQLAVVPTIAVMFVFWIMRSQHYYDKYSNAMIVGSASTTNIGRDGDVPTDGDNEEDETPFMYHWCLLRSRGHGDTAVIKAVTTE